MDRSSLPGLDALSACCWPVASLDRGALSTLQAEVLARHPGAMLLTSCQRIEAYSPAPCDCPAPARLVAFEALLHLSEVAAGIHSVVLGEAEVMGQVRAAGAKAPATLGPLVGQAVATARELRRETAFDSHAGHLLDRALRLSGTEPAGRLLVAGTGWMGRLIAGRGRALGFEAVIVAGRTKPEGAWFRDGGFQFVGLGGMAGIGTVSVAAGCLGSSAPELDPTRDLPGIEALIADFGTPRNFAAAADVRVVTIADLLEGGAPRRHGDPRRAALRSRLKEILEHRLALAAEDSVSAVGRLRLLVEQARREEVERSARLHPEVAPETLDAITRSLVNRIFHAPSERLRGIGDPATEQALLALFAPQED
ncbi:MAG: hypothetical protein HY875_06890 [Chloroflexi bacterium]|nr:hypothetical protein [Chloroflexota bacterium]